MAAMKAEPRLSCSLRADFIIYKLKQEGHLTISIVGSLSGPSTAPVGRRKGRILCHTIILSSTGILCFALLHHLSPCLLHYFWLMTKVLPSIFLRR